MRSSCLQGLTFAHAPGSCRYPTCPGLTVREETALRMAQKGARQQDWWHLVSVHKIPVSEASFGRSRRVWDKVHEEFHRLQDEIERLKGE